MRLPKNAKIIDVGCGTGLTLNFFRNNGYNYSIGIDNSKNALNICKKLFDFIIGKDIFWMYADDMKFPNSYFDLVFSEGLLEHFINSSRIIREHCRISRKYVLIFQPNHNSFFGLIKRIIERFGKASWEREYFYAKEDYINLFLKYNFKLINNGGINFNELMWLLFKR